MTDRLKSLIDRARRCRMTPEERLEQEIGGAWGNVHLHNPSITREMVRDATVDVRGPRVGEP